MVTAFMGYPYVLGFDGTTSAIIAVGGIFSVVALLGYCAWSDHKKLKGE